MTATPRHIHDMWFKTHAFELGGHLLGSRLIGAEARRHHDHPVTHIDHIGAFKYRIAVYAMHDGHTSAQHAPG